MTEPLYTITYILGVAAALAVVAVLIVALIKARRRIIQSNAKRRQRDAIIQMMKADEQSGLYDD